MKKGILMLILISISLCGFSQFKMADGGRVSIGKIVTPLSSSNTQTAPLTIYSNPNCWHDRAEISFINSTGHEFVIGNCKRSLWHADNTFHIWDKTSDRYLMEFRQEATYIHNKLSLSEGWLHIYRDSVASSQQAKNYKFNSRLKGKYGMLIESTYNEDAGIYLDEDFAAIWSAGDSYLLKVIDEDGMSLKWYLNGSGTAYTNSDRNRKTEIKALENSLDKIMQLEGVNYRFKLNEEEIAKRDSLGGMHVKCGTTSQLGELSEPAGELTCGFIAQDLEAVIPEVVETDENGDKFVNYDGVIPYLVEGIKTQQHIIDSLDTKIDVQYLEIEDLRAELSEINSELSELRVKMSSNAENVLSSNKLYQNSPNPFNKTTEICYELEATTTTAMINIYDMTGAQLRSIPLKNDGKGCITINAKEFRAGLYMYSLIADGQLIDTKRMVLTE